MKKILLLIRFLVALFVPKEDLQDELDKLDAKIRKKKKAMSDAMLFGDDDLSNRLRAEWLQLCRQYGRLRDRLPKDSHS